MGWIGARTSNTTQQAYFTSPELATAVTDIARKFKGPHIELGVGDGALYNRLPAPKVGVELQHMKPRLKGVLYGTDALTWKPARTGGVVVMNPPFAQQTSFFNHAATGVQADVIVWIAGLNARLWTSEDKLDRNMHLHAEWLVPPEWSTFRTERGPVQIRTVVQVWKRNSHHQRPLWGLKSTLSTSRDQLNPPQTAVVVKKAGTAADVGKSVPFRESNPRRDGTVLRTDNGTLMPAQGTALAFDRAVPGLSAKQKSGILHDLLYHRSYSKSLFLLSLPILSAALAPDWKRLIRPITYLDKRRRSKNQW